MYDSIKDASLDINIDNSSIGKVVKGIQETAGGYHWKIAQIQIKISLQRNIKKEQVNAYGIIRNTFGW